MLALLLMSSGVVQLAHVAAEHSIPTRTSDDCARACDTHEAPVAPVPATPTEHADCSICHLISHFSADVPVVDALTFAPLVQVDVLPMLDQQPAIAAAPTSVGPRAPPFFSA